MISTLSLDAFDVVMIEIYWFLPWSQLKTLHYQEVPKVVPKKSSARKKTTAIQTKITEYNKDKTPDLSLEANNNTITIIKGSKTKPGMLSMPNISDCRLGRNVAFDLGSDVELNLVQMFENRLPNDDI